MLTKRKIEENLTCQLYAYKMTQKKIFNHSLLSSYETNASFSILGFDYAELSTEFTLICAFRI